VCVCVCVCVCVEFTLKKDGLSRINIESRSAVIIYYYKRVIYYEKRINSFQKSPSKPFLFTFQRPAIIFLCKLCTRCVRCRLSRLSNDFRTFDKKILRSLLLILYRAEQIA